MSCSERIGSSPSETGAQLPGLLVQLGLFTQQICESPHLSSNVLQKGAVKMQLILQAEQASEPSSHRLSGLWIALLSAGQDLLAKSQPAPSLVMKFHGQKGAKP